MSALLSSFPLLWAQAAAPNPPQVGIPREALVRLKWLYPLERPDCHHPGPRRRGSDLAQGDQSRLPGLLGRRPGW